MRYTIKDFHKQFRNDADCLEFIYRRCYPQGATCRKCLRTDAFYPVTDRRAYACVCGHQIHPTVGTIFHKSRTSLKSWLFAMYLMTNAKNGVAAKELERQLGVTYKCAWRMGHQLRQLLAENGLQLSGNVEADETYFGPRKPGKRGRGSSGKAILVGVVEREGSIAATHVNDVSAKTVVGHIMEHVAPESTVITDEFTSYRRLTKQGFVHRKVRHRRKQYVNGTLHTNTIEGFWSQLKRSIHGTFHHVSRKHLQKYVNEFSYRYNRRKSKIPMFCLLLPRVGEPHGPAV